MVVVLSFGGRKEQSQGLDVVGREWKSGRTMVGGKL